MSRQKSQRDIRSRIKHENVHLGGGAELGGGPAPKPARQPWEQHGASYSTVSTSSIGAPMMPRSGSSNDVNGASSSSNNTASAAASAIAAANLGAGPSFVSLSPSDSISNFEGRAGTRGLGAAFDHAPMGTMPLAGMLPTSGQRSGGPGLFEPSAGSTASFAQNLGAGDGSREDGSTPLRPARSQRRPLQAPSASPQDGFSRTPSSRRQQYAGAATDAASSSVQAVGRNLLQATHGQSPSRGSNTSAGDRHARSARLMAEVASGGDNGRATPNSWTRAGESADEADFDDVYGGMDGGVDDGAGQYANNHRATLNVEQTTPTLGSLTRREEPAALGSVLSALSAAGRKQGAARILRGTTAEEESRRRKRERKVEDARGKEVRPLEHYVDRADEKAFREICAVLRKVKAEWGFIVDDDFNYVSLALSLLDDSSLGSNRNQFSEMQKLIERGLQGTVDDHHESFATAISLHSNVLSSLTSAQTSISGARRRLRDSREALGAKRADLVQLWHRSQGVKESLRLLDTIELLKGVPDRLESLMSEKRFLEAVNVLMHSLKQIDKTDIVEVGATADLRGYLKGQEQAMFDILIEELHNHLYLKSFFCDARWKAYSAGQSTLPNVEFGSDYQESQQQQQQFNGTSTSAQDELGGLKRDDADQQGSGLIDPGSNGALSTTATGERPLQVFRFINALSTRPAYDPNLASDMANLGLSASGSAAGLDPSVDATMATSKSADSNLTLMGSGGAAQAQTGGGPSKIAASSTAFEQNPEADSFLYIEMLLESLARLGKLRLALDIVAQRLPIELHQLVEATIDEVDERNEPLRRSSVAIVRPESLLLSSSSALARSFAEGARSSFGSNLNAGRSSGAFMSASASSAATFMGPGARTSTVFRLSASETSAMERDSETMRDLFWTLFSKLDAVLQGHRVVYEVATKIMSRDGGKSQDASTSIRHRPPPQRTMAGKTPSHGSASMTNLIEVWKPIQTEVRTLLHEHLMDDSESTSARRNAIVSVNEVLRLGTFGRDKSKQLFKLAETAPRPGVNVSRKDFAPLRRHEEALTAALRASVPGLVGAADTSANAGISAFQQQQHHHTLQQQHQQHTLFSSLSSIAAGAGSSSGPNAGAGHRILVKPDAFNISVLFQPALAFIERVQMILPGEAAGESSKGFSAFLEEFVQDVFLAQLEEKVQTLFQSAVGGPDAFQEDPTSKSALQRPVVKATANVLVLVDSLYSMLRTTPFHRESYSHLVIQTLVQFYQRCHERFRDLVTTDVSSQEGSQHYHLSAAWAQRPELTQCLSEYVGGSCDATRRRELLEQENAFELLWASQLKGAKGGPSGGTIALHDLTTSRKKLTSLGNLHYSLVSVMNAWSFDESIDSHLHARHSSGSSVTSLASNRQTRIFPLRLLLVPVFLSLVTLLQSLDAKVKAGPTPKRKKVS